MKNKSKASNSDNQAKSKKSSKGGRRCKIYVWTSTINHEKRTNLPKLDSGSTDVPKTITLDPLDSMNDKDRFSTWTDVIKCSVFSYRHFHCIKCDKIFESRNLEIFHCKNSLSCKRHIIDQSLKTSTSLISGLLIL